MKTCRGNRTFSVNRATGVLHAVADGSRVHIQADVIHRLHGGASFGVSESASPLSSAFVHQALLLHRPIHSNLPGKWRFDAVTMGLRLKIPQLLPIIYRTRLTFTLKARL